MVSEIFIFLEIKINISFTHKPDVTCVNTKLKKLPWKKVSYSCSLGKVSSEVLELEGLWYLSPEEVEHFPTWRAHKFQVRFRTCSKRKWSRSSIIENSTMTWPQIPQMLQGKMNKNNYLDGLVPCQWQCCSWLKVGDNF